MTKTGGLCSAMLAALVFLAACEKPVHLTTPPPPGAQTAPVTLSVTDTPPTGVLVLSFQLTFTGATLQPGNVSLLSSPVTLEASGLQTTAADLGTTNVPVGTYSSVSFNVASPVLTISNQSGATVAGTCANNSICKLTGSATPTTISVPVSVTVTANTPVGLLADLNLNNIIQSNLSLTLNSTSLSLSLLPPAPIPLTGTLQTIEGFLGQVTALGTNQFTVRNAPSNLSLVISASPTTAFQNFDTLGCTASPQNFSCLQVGQIVAVDLNVLGNGTLAATTVDAEDSVNLQDVEGVLVATGPGASQFQMVVLDEEPNVPGISVGDLILVNIAQPAAFGIDSDGLTVSGFTFAGTSDLLVGQEIQVQVTSVVLNSNPPPTQQVNTSRVRLRMSQFTASVNSKVNATTFTVTRLSASGLPAMVTTGPVTVSTSSQTEFNPSSLTVATLNLNDTVSLRGLLFNPAGGPTLVVRNVRKR